jgi:predicted amidophosphoribosyltransferase
MNNDSLKRTRQTPPQAKTATLEERIKNVDGAFTCVWSAMVGKSIILIDDVTTFGVTLNACALVLKQAGTTKVRGLILARDI